MKCLGLFVMVILFTVVYSQDAGETEDIPGENDRDTKELSHEGWRVVDIPIPKEYSDWIPKEQNPEDRVQLAPKRRRLRKRKRRPQPLNDSSNVSFDERPLRKRPRPQLWEEMDDEVLTRPNIRRRVPPPYEPSSESVEESSHQENNQQHTEIELENRTKPLKGTISAQRQEELRDHSMNNLADLKALLKQSGGSLSLSEILQQKNISLSELLSGNEKAISALTEKSIRATEPQSMEKSTDTDPTAKYKRLPPSIALKKNISRTFEQDIDSMETIPNKQLQEAQRRRLALLQNHKENKIFSSVTKFDVVTEAMTEKRIFVPSHPKYYTSLSYKPDMTILDQSTEPISQVTERHTTITFTTDYPKIKPTDYMYLKPKLKSGSITTAKMKTTTKIVKKPQKVMISESEEEDENYPLPFDFPKPIKIKVFEVAGFKDNHKNEELRKPQKIPIEIISTKSTTIRTTTRAMIEQAPSSESSKNSPYITAKEEINEILKDEKSRERLSKILQMRNMTLDELVEQRERGSSQLHLADIFHNKTREPEPKEAPLIGQIIPDVPKRKQKSQSFKEETTNQYISILNVKPTEHPRQEIPHQSGIHFPTIQADKKIQSFPWRQMYPDLFPELSEKERKSSKPTVIGSAEEVHIIDVTDNTLASNEQFIADTSEDEGIFKNIPSTVKSAMFVSFAIIGMSIVVFLTIFVIFRWSQRHQRKLNYSSSLTTRLKSPIIKQSNHIKSFMNETLSRKHYYKSNVQSMSDDLWDSERTRKESF